MTAARAATVRASSMWRTVTSRRVWCRNRPAIRLADSDVPPLSKNSLCRPTLSRGSPRTVAQPSATTISVPVRGASIWWCVGAGAGSARRSSFPLGVTGKWSTTVMWVGMWVGGRMLRS